MKNIFALLLLFFRLYTSQTQDYHHYFISWADIDLWNRDDAGIEAVVEETFIPLTEIDGYKPIFWPEAYGICNSIYWYRLVQTIIQ